MIKETETQLRNKINWLRIKLDKIEEKKIAREQCKYVGKYYKFRNCYSDQNYWYEYLKVLRLDNDNNLKCLLFCKDTYNIYRIEKDYTSMYYSSLNNRWIEITEQEFTLEWKKMLSEINFYYK